MDFREKAIQLVLEIEDNSVAEYIYNLIKIIVPKITTKPRAESLAASRRA